MLIVCGVTANVDDDDEGVTLDSGVDEAAVKLQATKLELLELLLAHGIAKLTANADGAGDSGEFYPAACYTEPSEGQFESCETPDGADALVETIFESIDVSFNNDGGFANLTITTATRECEIEIGWYYTESSSNSETETL